MKPLVSMVIPCDNAAPRLAATLGPALAQTWEPKETSVVDDGSTDASLEPARAVALGGSPLRPPGDLREICPGFMRHSG